MTLAQQFLCLHTGFLRKVKVKANGKAEVKVKVEAKNKFEV